MASAQLVNLAKSTLWDDGFGSNVETTSNLFYVYSIFGVYFVVVLSSCMSHLILKIRINQQSKMVRVGRLGISSLYRVAGLVVCTSTQTTSNRHCIAQHSKALWHFENSHTFGPTVERGWTESFCCYFAHVKIGWLLVRCAIGDRCERQREATSFLIILRRRQSTLFTSICILPNRMCSASTRHDVCHARFSFGCCCCCMSMWLRCTEKHVYTHTDAVCCCFCFYQCWLCL